MSFQHQLDAMQELLDINKLLDDKAHSQGLTFTTMDPALRVANGLSTGVYSFDLITGGGYASGRFSYLYGDTGSAKSTTLYHGIHSALNNSIITVLNDHEASMDPTYLKKIGIDLDEVCGVRNKKGTWEVTPKLRYSVGTTAESTFKFMNLVMKSLPDKIQMFDSKTEKNHYFLISPDYEYKPVWASITKGLKEQKIIEVEDFSPQMVFITDSLKAMLPDAKDNDIDSDPIALQARSFSASFPLVKSLIGRKNCIYLATNHITVNPLIRYGCLQAETPVPLVDGRSFPIREIVEKRIEGEVWSYDEATNKIVPAKIIDWYYNGKIEKPEDFITVKCDAIDTANGLAGFTCTREHKVLTKDGWKPAESLNLDDLLVTKYESIINGSLKSFLLGTMVADCSITSAGGLDRVHKLLFQDSSNPEYLKWKLSKLEDHLSFKLVGDTYYASESRHEFTVWKRLLGTVITEAWKDLDQHVVRDPSKVIDQMDDLSLAIWFMDDGYGDFNTDGHFCGRLIIKRFRSYPDKLEDIVSGFARMGYSVTANAGEIRFNKESFLLLCDRVCRYVPECMQYKLPPEYRGKYQDFTLDCTPTFELDYVPIRSISQKASVRKFSQKGKYDLKIENTHNYMVGNRANGVIVHNSNESEPGGKAVQFYPDLKIKMHINRAQSKIIEETHVSGEGIDRYIMGKATVLKNKAGPCFRSIEFRVWLDEQGAPGRGIDPVFDIYTCLESCGLIDRITKDSFGIKIKGWETEKFTWKKFKELVLLKEEGKTLKNHIDAMMADGSAQERYYQTLAAGMGVKAAAKELEGEIETVEL